MTGAGGLNAFRGILFLQDLEFLIERQLLDQSIAEVGVVINK